MRVESAFMPLFIGLCDVEKYQFKWLRVLGLCERTGVRVLCIPIMCWLLHYWFFFIICMGMGLTLWSYH